jgi:hydroxyethylthiazole kinase-like uncharacterized protein yjeF
MKVMQSANNPKDWLDTFPIPNKSTHKYKRGQVLVLGGKCMTGAPCLAADAAAKTGAGLVTIISPCLSIFQKIFKLHDPIAIYQSFKPYIMAKNSISIEDAITSGKTKGITCTVIGPGLGNNAYASIRKTVKTLLTHQTPVVLDADGLNAYEGHAALLFKNLHQNTVLTPHEGEFKKLFPELPLNSLEDRIESARKASKQSGAIIVLKGFQTIISNGNEAMINDNASPYLATAGAGDALSGIIAGLMAQGMHSYDAARCGVWIHGKTSEICGPGMVASDIIEKIPQVLKEMLGINKKVG